MASVTGLQKYQIIHDPAGIQVRVNLRTDAPAGTLDEIHRRIQTALIDAGAAPPPINVTERDDFIVTGIGKHRLVIDQATTAPSPSLAPLRPAY
jgi:hypothetical protein